jgi:ERCC4-related helicase
MVPNHISIGGKRWLRFLNLKIFPLLLITVANAIAQCSFSLGSIFGKSTRLGLLSIEGDEQKIRDLARLHRRARRKNQTGGSMKQQHWSIAKTPDREIQVAKAIERLGVKGITTLLTKLLEMAAEQIPISQKKEDTWDN